ncbi:DUF924 domain-containing protein [Romeria aff. gracilis LEGE 07310]|uniref:DUF924 domain-containing protein n=1 Tax=Vasconcelosia minhoensis LEGE 07310 TaxID=915328 RepID=A0A8J7A714_9CYAN|nr:DUF924 family protein [Romeria gracilis]MBE9078032.1 DUF924 domain-containing protein [Romeria aff. gracilis LEGE 07310]
MSRPNKILAFWFNDPDPQHHYGEFRQVWFKKDPNFDAQIRQRFLNDYEQAAAGQFASWQEQPRSCLALILLLDQFPRNLFRGRPRSFATDDQALAAAKSAIAHNFDRALIPIERNFLYLPFEHSERLAHQQQSVALFTVLANIAPELQHSLDYALKHRDVIAKFGRFPHRNAILSRQTTAEEDAYLQQHGGF